jgi:dynein heavy chain 2
LNSVLDDNHLLTLPTGERINFPQGTCFIFETDSLLYASPATVSRMGMIYLNNEDINISGLIEKWLENHAHLRDFFKTLAIESLLGYDEVVQSTLVGQVNQVLSMMTGVKTQQEFIVACIKGFTANFLADRTAIVAKIFERFSERNPVSPK